MSKEFYLKPMATILISAVIATAASALITATYFKPKVLSEEEIGKIAATYLVKNPHYLVEAGKALENQNVSASVERIIPYAPALLDTKETPNIGPDDADVAVIEFFDYQCIYCMRVTPVVESVMNQSKDVKFFFKEFRFLPVQNLYLPWGPLRVCTSIRISVLKPIVSTTTT